MRLLLAVDWGGGVVVWGFLLIFNDELSNILIVEYYEIVKN